MKIKYYNPPNSIVQKLPVKEKVKYIEFNPMKNSYFVDISTSVDLQETVKIEREVTQIYEDVEYRENFELSPFRKVIGKMFFKTKIQRRG